MIHLHVHSHYSLLCGAASPQELVQRAASLGFPALALTDLNAMHGTVEFQKACQRAGLQPLHGVELTADRPSGPAPGSLADATAGADDVFNNDNAPVRLIPRSLAPGRPRAVLLARDDAGYAALCRLTTLRQVRPDFDLASELPEFLGSEGHGVFCLTDSVPLLQTLALAAERRKESNLLAGSLRVLLPTVGGQLGPLYRKLRELAAWAAAHNVPVTAGGDVYAAVPADLERARLLAAIRNLRTVDTVAADCCPPQGSWLRPAAEMRRLLDEFPAACPETESIAEQCRFRHKLGKWRYPEFPLPAGETAESYLWKLCFDGLQKRYRRVTSQAMARLQEEINVVQKLEFAGYFLIVWDIVRFAADRGMPTLGRGSAANSLISYLLGITHVDPLKHDLYFQRFLNPERLSPPDIDLDFGWRDRDEVLAYVYDRYGRDRAAMICNINRFSTRSSLRESAKACGRGGRELDRRPRHLGIHAGGVVIAGRPLTDLFPLQWARKGLLISQLDMYSIEDLGLVKIDLLSQRGLAVVADAARAVNEHQGVPVDLSKVPEDDPATRRLLRTGETMGCFYIESPGMRSLLKKLKADTFSVVVAASSVIRPGPSDSGMSRSFVLRHLGKERPTLPHPSLGFLNETYGVMIYQEDVMRTLGAVAGLTLAEADLMRRAMSFKGDPGEFLAMRDRFLEGARAAVAAGTAPPVDAELLDELWRQISSFAGYAFCKAHSASYAVLSFQAAWLKAHHPAEFMAAVMSNGGGFYSVSAYLEEARRLGLEILLPDVNHSRDVFTGRDRQVRIGLQQIHGMSRRSLDALLDERDGGGFFVSLGDLLRRVPQLAENEVEHLIRCGACDGFELTRPQLLWRHALLRKERRRSGGGHRHVAGDRAAHAGRVTVQTATLFPTGGLSSPAAAAVSLVPAIPDYSHAEKLQQEMEILHLTATGHPVALLRGWLQERGAIPARDLPGWAGRRVKIAGNLITARSVVVKKTGLPMKFLTLEDESGLCEVTLFPRVYARYGGRLLNRGPYLVTGLVEDDHGSVTLTAEALEII